MKILVTGSAGFIGYHLVDFLIHTDNEIIGLDIINDYYDVNLKYSRLANHGITNISSSERLIYKSQLFSNYSFVKADLTDHDFIVDFIVREKFDVIVNLAAQAGVRYSLENPKAYTLSNIDGFLSILEGCRHGKVSHLIYASTSSVYGLNEHMPLSEMDVSDHPKTLYAATKKANEMMAHSYSHLFNIPTTGLRFFTVYGPWGRPDMALFLFANAMVKGEPIRLFNNGNMIRDFTYVIDIVQSIIRLLPKPPKANLLWDGNSPQIPTSSAPFQIFNLGNSKPVQLLQYVNCLEAALDIKAIKIMSEMHPGDVIETHADTLLIEKYIDFKPNTSIETGILNFVQWFKSYYEI